MPSRLPELCIMALGSSHVSATGVRPQGHQLGTSWSHTNNDTNPSPACHCACCPTMTHTTLRSDPHLAISSQPHAQQSPPAPYAGPQAPQPPQPCHQGSADPRPCAQVPLDRCPLNLESGNPYLFEDYWVRHPQPALTMQPSAHLGYGLAYGHLPRLVSAIQNLHAMVSPASSNCWWPARGGCWQI